MHGEQTIKRLNQAEQGHVDAILAEHAKPHTDPFAAVAAEAIAKHTAANASTTNGSSAS